MNTSLAGRTLCILGGNGFVGSAIASQAVDLGAKVYCVNRSGKLNAPAPWVEKVTWVKGDAMSPNDFSAVLEESEAVVHSIGALFDSSITKFRRPGAEGTYEHMNRETAKSIGQKLNELKGNKKMVYLSASKSIPFIPRYLTTKIEAEDFLFDLSDVRTSVLRPGVISSDEKLTKKFIKYPVNIYSSIFNFFDGITPYESRVKPFVKKFDVDKSIDIKSVAISALICCFDPKFDDKILYNTDMKELKELFLEHGYEFPS